MNARTAATRTPAPRFVLFEAPLARRTKRFNAEVGWGRVVGEVTLACYREMDDWGM